MLTCAVSSIPYLEIEMSLSLTRLSIFIIISFLSLDFKPVSLLLF